MDKKQENLDHFVKKLLELQAEKEQEATFSDEDLKFIAEGMGVEVEDLEKAREDYATRAKGHLQYHNWQDAIKEYQQLLILSPQDAEAYYGLACAHAGLWKEKYSNAEKEKAIEYTEKALTFNPAHQQALQLLSQLRKKRQSPKSSYTHKINPKTSTKRALNTNLVAIVLVTLMVGASIFSTRYIGISIDNALKSSSKTNSSTSSSGVIYASVASIDNRGAVYWSIEYEQYHTNSSLVRDFFARIIDPKTGKEIKKIDFAKAEKITNYKWRKAKLIKDKLYNFDRDAQTFEARDTHTGKVVENLDILSQKYEELKNGIGEVKEEGTWYKLTLKNGDVFWYSPYLTLLHSDKEHTFWENNDKNIHLSYEWNFEAEGAKRRYYLFEKEKRNQHFNNHKTRPSQIDFTNKNQRFFQARYGTQISTQPSEWFLQAQILYADKEVCLILHKKEIGPSSPNVLSAIDKNGTTLWQKADFKSIFLKNLEYDKLYNINTSKYQDTLVLEFPYLRINNKNYRFAIALDTKTGKILWEYSPDY